MDVKAVCLGMLTSGPASGYDLKKYFESTFGHFFAAGFGSIYPALNSLAEAGLVTCTEIAQDGKPDRKVYCITDEGRNELMRVLENPSPAHKVRSEFLATLFFAHLMPQEQVENILDNRLQEIETFLDTLGAMDMSDPQQWPAGTKFVAGFGEMMAKACKCYIEENRCLLTGDSAKDDLRTSHG